MTVYYEIDLLPEEYDRLSQFMRLDRIWADGKQSIMDAYEFLDGCLTDDGDFCFSRTIGWEDAFFASLYIRLPSEVRYRLKQTVADLAVIATAFANTKIDFGFKEVR
jgi:hypothetical protein